MVLQAYLTLPEVQYQRCDLYCTIVIMALVARDADKPHVLRLVDRAKLPLPFKRVVVADGSVPPPPGATVQPRTAIIVRLIRTHQFQFASCGQLHETKLQPGDVLFVQKGSWLWRRTKRMGVNLNLGFEPDFVRYRSKGFNTAGKWIELCCHTPPADQALWHMVQACEALVQRDGGTDELVQLLSLSFQRALDHLKQHQPAVQSGPTVLWQRACAYLQENAADTALSRDTVAAALGCDPAYLSRVFRQQGNTNFIDDLNQIRIATAKAYLRNPNLTLDQIAEACGYTSAAYFIRVFRQFNGCTPGRYRQAHR